MLNRLGNLFGKSLFGIPGLYSGKDFGRIAKIRVEESRKIMLKWRLRAASSPAEDIEVLDGVSNSLCGIADAAEFIRNVHADPEWVQGATKAVEVVSGFMNEANVDSALFHRATAVMHTGGQNVLNKEYMHVITAMVDAMKNEGVGLASEAKAKLVALQEQDMIKSFEITRSSDSPSNSGVWINEKCVEGRWNNLLASRCVNGQNQLLVVPAVVPHVMKSVHDRATREYIWAQSQIVSEPVRAKEEAMHELVGIRKELANLRGYKNWNHYAQRESVLGGPLAVESFLANLWTDLLPGLSRELAALSALNKGHTVEAWDMDYLTNRWKMDNIDSMTGIAEIEKNLNFQRILAGGQLVLKKVLGVDLQFDRSAALWHPDAFRLSLARDGVPFSYMYIDPYERAAKSVQSAQFTLAGSKLLSNGTRQVPQTALVLALPGDPTLPVPLNVAITFFHELGHACHSLLSETDLQHFSGSRGAIDFVEFPSHLFEYFATEPETLDEILGGQVAAKDLEQYGRNRNPFAHLEIAQQLVYAMVDQVYYATGTPTNLAAHLPKGGESILALLQPNSVASFDHLVHYGGSYYCYLLCRAMAAQVWDGAFRGNALKTNSQLCTFFKHGSVDQSLSAIYSIDPTAEATICTQPLIRDISRCASIHP